MTCLDPCPLGKWALKDTCPARRDGTEIFSSHAHIWHTSALTPAPPILATTPPPPPTHTHTHTHPPFLLPSPSYKRAVSWRCSNMSIKFYVKMLEEMLSKHGLAFYLSGRPTSWCRWSRSLGRWTYEAFIIVGILYQCWLQIKSNG